MSELDRPPLPAIMYELIEDQLRKIDEQHEQILQTFSVNSEVSAGQRAPARQPGKLMNALDVYASNLFVAEAKQYGEFRRNESYSRWLVRLKDRTIARIFETIALLQQRPNVHLEYHGLTDDEIRANLNTLLMQAANEYTWLAGNPTIESAATRQPTSVATVPEEKIPAASRTSPITERAALRDSYRAAFPDVKIQDICWAAGQTYREWRRWINGEVKNGLKPDRAFRRVLTSGKMPEEIRKQPRPTKYNT